MPELIVPNRRMFIGGAFAAGATLALPACTTYGGGYSLTEAVRQLLLLSSERAFMRLAAPGGFWDQQVAQVGLNGYFGNRGNVLANILTSSLFKSRLENQVARIAVDASYRAAPIVTDAVRTVGFSNAIDLIRGGPSAATYFMRQQIGVRLIDMLVPDIGNALRIAQDPLMGQMIAGLTGVDVGGVASSFAGRVEETIWGEIGREEANIRANPSSTNNAMLIAALTAGRAF